MKRKSLFCDSCDFIFDRKWHNLSLSDLVLADKYMRLSRRRPLSKSNTFDPNFMKLGHIV